MHAEGECAKDRLLFIYIHGCHVSHMGPVDLYKVPECQAFFSCEVHFFVIFTGHA